MVWDPYLYVGTSLVDVYEFGHVIEEGAVAARIFVTIGATVQLQSYRRRKSVLAEVH